MKTKVIGYIKVNIDGVDKYIEVYAEEKFSFNCVLATVDELLEYNEYDDNDYVNSNLPYGEQ